VTLLAFYLWKPTRSWGRLGIVFLVLLLLSAPFIFSTVVQRFAQAGADSFGGRLIIWQAGLKLIRDHLIFGVGIGNADRSVMPYLSRITRTWDWTERSMHNPVFQIWAETGIIGLLLYLGVLGSALSSFYHKVTLHMKKASTLWVSYYALAFGLSIGILTTWIKGGGMEQAPSYFFMLSLLLIPSIVNTETVDVRNTEN
jgi:O-antigen ligase